MHLARVRWGERVPGRQKMLVRAAGRQSQKTGPRRERPQLVIGIVIPLPDQRELAAVKLVRRHDAGHQAFAGGKLQFIPNSASSISGHFSNFLLRNIVSIGRSFI